MKNREKDILDYIKTIDISKVTNKEIAKVLGVHHQTISNCLSKNGFVKKTVNRKHNDLLEKIKTFIKKGMTQKQIALELNLTVRQVTCFCNHSKISNPNVSETVCFTNEEFQVILGSLLGDGNIDNYGRLRLKHSSKQCKYVKLKAEYLSNYTSSFKEKLSQLDKRTNKVYTFTKWDSRVLKNFKDLRKNWYPLEEKEIFINDFEKIDGLGLAIWYMDDGFKSNAGIKIATDSFKKSSLLKIISILYDKFELDFKIDSRNRIYLLKKDFNAFCKIVKPYMCESLMYKLNTTKLKQDELLETPITVGEDNQQPSLNSNVFEGSTTNSRVLSSNIEDSNADTSVLPVTNNN
jgi:DNA-binding CsgD family transcriptional regulator